MACEDQRLRGLLDTRRTRSLQRIFRANVRQIAVVEEVEERRKSGKERKKEWTKEKTIEGKLLSLFLLFLRCLCTFDV